jgi:hypothetical protein
MRMRRSYSWVFLVLVFVGIPFLLLGCARGPNKEWAKGQVRARLSEFWLDGEIHPQEGVHYSFGKLEVTESGRSARLYFNVSPGVWMFRSKAQIYSSLRLATYRGDLGPYSVHFQRDAGGGPWYLLDGKMGN